MQKGNFIQRVLQFAEGKGFYMILGLCVVAIGVSAYVLFFTTPPQEPLTGEVVSGQISQPDIQAANPVPDVTVPREDDREQNRAATAPSAVQSSGAEGDEPPSQTPVSRPEPQEDRAAAGTDPEPSNAIRVDAPATVKEPVFTLPVQAAQVQRDYSGDTLVFDPTMSDWRVHGGTDFSCDEGDTVMAVLDGTVAEIFSDAMMGPCIRLDHGAELETLYCGVIPQDNLQVGTMVAAGQTIGRAGNSLPAESAQECHVHLEMTEEGVPIDPMTVLK